MGCGFEPRQRRLPHAADGCLQPDLQGQHRALLVQDALRGGVHRRLVLWLIWLCGRRRSRQQPVLDGHRRIVGPHGQPLRPRVDLGCVAGLRGGHRQLALQQRLPRPQPLVHRRRRIGADPLICPARERPRLPVDRRLVSIVAGLGHAARPRESRPLESFHSLGVQPLRHWPVAAWDSGSDAAGYV
eukprot:scaffold3256_cov114-Isochrysis_galbana.AAC.13